MKPNFSLSLSFDGIRLLYRGKSGWSEIGSVSLEDDDLSGALASLRAKAIDAAPGGLRSKLIIPNDQIKYLALPEKGLKDADIRAALEGATPYDVSELSYDFAEHEDGTAVAAVANETLEEAEAFATEHDFGPVCFVAVPEAGAFPGEPFFGKAKAAADSKVTRDKKPVPLGTIPGAAPTSDDTEQAEAGPDTAPEEISEPIDQPDAQAADDDAPAEIEEPKEISVEATEAQVTETPEPDLEPTPPAKTEAEPSEADKPQPQSTEETPDAQSPDAPEETGPEPRAVDPDPPETDETTEPDGLGIGAASDDSPFNEPTAADNEPAAEDKDAEPDVEDAPSDAPADDAAEESTGEPDASPEDDAGAIAAREIPPAQDPAPAEPVFSSRLRSVRQELELPPQPVVRRPNGSISPGSADDARPPLAASAPGSATSVPESRTPMPPAVTEALKKAERREVVPPRVGSAGMGTSDSPQSISSPVARPATPPPPAVSKALERVRNSPDLPPINGSALSRPIPGAGPAAPVASAPPSLPSAPSRSDVPPPVRQTPKNPSVVTETAIPAPPAEVAASLSASAGPAGAAPERTKPTKRRFGLPGGRNAKDQASVMRAATAEAPAPGPDPVRSETEKERLTVFGARRKEAEVGGKPKFLGLILTAILLLLMAAVAAWAAISTDTFARLFGLTDPPAITSETESGDAPALAVTPPQPATAPEPAFEPTPLPADESPFGSGTVPSGAMLMSETGSLLPDPDLLRALSAPTPAQAVADVPGAVLSPAAAERFYAATGVWLRAPRLPVEPQPEPLGPVVRTGSEEPPQLGTTPQLPQAAPDPVLTAQLDPPPPDMSFERDARGFLLATPDGTVTPDGLLIFAGSPSIVPPTRPGTPPVVPEAESVAPETTAAAEPPDATVEQSPTPDEPTELAAAPEPSVEPVIADATDSLATEALAVLEEVPIRPDARISTAGTLNAAAITLNGIRPAVRPEDAIPESLLPDVELASFTGPRPSLRPEGLAPEAERTEAPEEAEVPAGDDVESALAGILAGAADPLATATPNAVASAIRPDSRPNNFDRVVQQQRARQQASAPAPSAPSSGSQPEAVSNAAAQPTGPVPQTVASAATVENAINLRQINLIGVYGRPNDRRALVRLSNGRYVRVGVGDSLDGGRVAAINDNTLNYVKSGRTVTLEIPSG